MPPLLFFARRAERKLLEAAPAAIWIHDAAGLITFANPRIAELLGVSGETLAGRRVEEFYFPSDVSIEKLRLASQQFDRRLRRADGSEVWVLASSAARGDEYLSVMADITERKRAEQSLRRAQQRQRDFLDLVVEGLYETTPEGRVTAANPALVKMLGCDREAELIGTGLFDIPARRALFEQLRREGTLRRVESEFRTASGAMIATLESAQAVRDGQGAVTGYEGAVSALSRGADPLPQPPASAATILLLEDDPLLRELTRDMLERQGYRVVFDTEASSLPDLLVADLTLAGLAEQIRDSRVPVLFLTSAPYPPETKPTAPNTFFIEKPFSAESLGQRIRMILAGEHRIG